jgi:hypothetical protein
MLIHEFPYWLILEPGECYQIKYHAMPSLEVEKLLAHIGTMLAILLPQNKKSSGELTTAVCVRVCVHAHACACKHIHIPVA